MIPNLEAAFSWFETCIAFANAAFRMQSYGFSGTAVALRSLEQLIVVYVLPFRKAFALGANF